MFFTLSPIASSALKKLYYFSSLSFPQLDSRSFFFDIAPGGESGVSGFVTLLAAAHALRNITQENHPNRTILYTLFQGVSNVNTVMAIAPNAALLPAVFSVSSWVGVF